MMIMENRTDACNGVWFFHLFEESTLAAAAAFA